MGSIYVICSRQCPNGDGIYTLLYALYKYSTSITKIQGSLSHSGGRRASQSAQRRPTSLAVSTAPADVPHGQHSGGRRPPRSAQRRPMFLAVSTAAADVPRDQHSGGRRPSRSAQRRPTSLAVSTAAADVPRGQYSGGRRPSGCLADHIA